MQETNLLLFLNGLFDRPVFGSVVPGRVSMLNVLLLLQGHLMLLGRVWSWFLQVLLFYLER